MHTQEHANQSTLASPGWGDWVAPAPKKPVREAVAEPETSQVESDDTMALTVEPDAWEQFAAGVSGRMQQAVGSPVELHALLGVAILAGVGLWLFGDRVVKPAFLMLGFVAGATLGFVLMPVLGPDTIERIPSPYVGFAGGSMLGLILSFFIFRFTIALAAAGVFAVGGVLSASLYIDRIGLPDLPPQAVAVAPAEDGTQPAAGLPREGLMLSGVPEVADGVLSIPLRLDLGLGSTPEAATDPDAETAPEPAATGPTLAERTRRVLGAGRAELAGLLDSIPAAERAVLFGAGLIGAALGGLIGLCMPKKAAMLVTALAGSAVWLLGVAVAMGAASLSIPSVLGDEPAARLILWVTVALIGIGGQMVVQKRAAARAAAE